MIDHNQNKMQGNRMSKDKRRDRVLIRASKGSPLFTYPSDPLMKNPCSLYKAPYIVALEGLDF